MSDEVEVWRAHNKQTTFLLSEADELLFGGGGGGGKTDASVVALLDIRQHAVFYPRYRAIVFRRKQKDLKQIYERAKEIYPALYRGVVFKGQYPLVAHFPSGAQILFSGITKDFEDDVQGQEYQRALWEELCQQPDDGNYRYLMSRLRCSWKRDFATRTFATANPIGAGRAWVRKRWRIDGQGSPSHFVALIKDPTTGQSFEQVRQFVPSLAVDNPHLNQSYLQQLALLPKTQQQALRDGRWDVKIGTFFEEFDVAVHSCTSFEIPSHWPRWRSLDWGFASPFCVLYHAMDHDGNIHTYHEFYGTNKTVEEVAAHMREFETQEQRQQPGVRYASSPADPSIWINQGRDRREPSIGDAFAGQGIAWAKATETDNSRVSGAMECRERLRRTKLGLGHGVMIHQKCKHWLRTVPELLFDKQSIEDVDTMMEDHAYDSWRYGLMRRRIPPDAPKVVTKLVLGKGSYE
jgi:phage terminase large subunit